MANNINASKNTFTRDNKSMYEVSQVLFRLSRWENLEYAKKI